MTKTLITTAAIAVLVALVFATNQREAISKVGEIVAVDDATRVITVEGENGAESFLIGNDTHIYANQEPALFDRLHEGQDVEVWARYERGGPHPATSVSILESTLVSQIEELPAVSTADTVSVVRADPVARTLAVHTSEGPRRYYIDDDTRIEAGARKIELSDLDPGERVVISAERDDGMLTATRVTVVAVARR